MIQKNQTQLANQYEGSDQCITSSFKFQKDLEILIRSRYALIGIQTYEEERLIKLVSNIAQMLGKRLLGWSVAQGLIQLDKGKSRKPLEASTTDPQVALKKIKDLVDPTIIILFDFHPFLKDPTIIRQLREVIIEFKSGCNSLLLVSPNIQVPMELEKEMSLMSMPLPDSVDLAELMDNIAKEIKMRGDICIDMEADVKERIVQATLGLTLSEAENVLARAIVTQGRLNIDAINLIISEKEQIIRRSGVLEFYSAWEKFDNIGGLEILKEWLRKRQKSFSSKARDFGLPAPKGILLIGVQGCGKSLTAKAVANYWGMPLLKLDVGSLFSSLVGSTEENLRRSLATAESVSPAILWVDEIEKGFSGLESSGKLDAGLSARVFGSLITWLQEKTTPVFVIATANDITRLPPEMMRKGRFDEIFFIDLPTDTERRQIFEIHLRKRSYFVNDFDIDILVNLTKGYSGAEIESSIVSAMFDVFDAGNKMMSKDIIKAIGETVPLSRLMQEKVQELRQWAEGRVRKASLQDS